MTSDVTKANETGYGSSEAASRILFYRSTGRRPAILGGGALCLVVTVASTIAGAPLLVLAPMVLASFGCLWAIVLNPVHGIDIDEESVTIVAPRSRAVYPIAEIARVEVETWTDGEDVRLVFADGRREAVSCLARPPRSVLTDALKRVGIETVVV